MSLDAYVLFNNSIDTVADWQRGIDQLKIPILLASKGSLGMLKGHLPAWWDGQEAGFECELCDVGEIARTYDDIDLGGTWRHAMAFNWGTFSGCVGALLAAAALAHTTRGVLFDPQEGTIMDAVGAIAYARDTAASLPELEATLAAMKQRR